MSIKIDIPYFLQYLTNDTEAAEVNGSTVGECLEHLVKQFPSIKQLLFDKNGKLEMFGDIYVNGGSIYPEGLEKPVKDGDELYIAILVGGG